MSDMDRGQLLELLGRITAERDEARTALEAQIAHSARLADACRAYVDGLHGIKYRVRQRLADYDEVVATVDEVLREAAK